MDRPGCRPGNELFRPDPPIPPLPLVRQHGDTVSLDSLTPDEHASFMLGQALRRAMLNRSKDKEAVELGARAWATYSALCDKILTMQEAVQIRRTTNLIDLSDQWEDGCRPRHWADDSGL